MFRRSRTHADHCHPSTSQSRSPPVIVIHDSDSEENSPPVVVGWEDQGSGQETLSLTERGESPEVITLSDSDEDDEQPSSSFVHQHKPASLAWTIPHERRCPRALKAPEVIVYDEKETRYNAYRKFLSNFNRCQITKEVYRHRKIEDREYLRKRICAMFFTLLWSKSKKSSKRPIDLSTFIFSPSYFPRNKTEGCIERLQFTQDIRYLGEILPVYCDMPMTSSDAIFTTATNFNHENRNYMSPDLVGADEAKKIVACCSCTFKCELPTCECLRLQHGICKSEIQHKGYGIVEEHYDYAKETGCQMNTYTNVLITCGELCSCSKFDPCDNHISKLDRGHQFEFFRADDKKGFGLRTLNPIQMDQIVCEFVGCVKPFDSIDCDYSLDYSFEQASDDLVYLLDRIQKKTGLYSDADFGMILVNEEGKKGLFYETYIDPYWLGSEARQASHSCTPNSGPLRVISNYLHPYYHRLFYKALVPIPAGTEITINYGPDYVNRRGFTCKCGTILCENAPQSTRQLWASLNFEQGVEALTVMVQNWQKIIDADHDEYFNFLADLNVPKGTPDPCYVMVECDELKTNNEKIIELPKKLNGKAENPTLGDRYPDLVVKSNYMRRSQEEIDRLENELAAAASRYLSTRKPLDSPDLLEKADSEDELSSKVKKRRPPTVNRARRGRQLKRKVPSPESSSSDGPSTSKKKSPRSSTEFDLLDKPHAPAARRSTEGGRDTLNSKRRIVR